MSFFGGNDRIQVIAEFHAKPASETVVRASLMALVAPSRKEDGCKAYTLHENLKDAHNFYTYEEWTSEAALDEHLTGVQSALDQVKPLLAEAMKITVLKQLG